MEELRDIVRTAVLAIEAAEAEVKRLRDTKTRCTCGGFVLQYEGRCSCQDGRRVRAADYAVRSAKETLVADVREWHSRYFRFAKARPDEETEEGT